MSFSRAQSSKFERLFGHVSVKRDVRALSFELWKSFRKCHPKWDWLYMYINIDILVYALVSRVQDFFCLISPVSDNKSGPDVYRFLDSGLSAKILGFSICTWKSLEWGLISCSLTIRIQHDITVASRSRSNSNHYCINEYTLHHIHYEQLSVYVWFFHGIFKVSQWDV